MLLRYTDAQDRQVEVELGQAKTIVIGRAPEADIVLPTEKASRAHCAIRFWDGEFVLKDLKSRNGTFVNDQRIEVAVIRSGDRIRVGGSVLTLDKKSAKGATTILREVGDEMEDEGKGYRTLLREIVEKTEDKGRK